MQASLSSLFPLKPPKVCQTQTKKLQQMLSPRCFLWLDVTNTS
ncbi:hypothetical protein SLEP1_g55695 [Rubroshorea leprosula]|uniref:Uncharacterized protein n=1 Tax=Rubroshorea leprosula TaxID=152421 RepID=A0AAV5MKD8_9ROSI|nr:hypothetical protein SLEP1_g55695 [Rubroshorea leprosula]